MMYLNTNFILNMAFLWIGATVLFDGKIKRIWMAILCYVGFLGVVLLCDMEMDFVTFLMSIVLVICYVLTVSFTSGKRRIKKICVLFILLYLQELFVMILDDIMLFYKRKMTNEEWNTINALWSLAILILIVVVCSKKKIYLHSSKFKEHIRKSMIPLLIFVAFEVVAMVLCFNIFTEKSANIRHYLVGTILSTLSMISIGIIVVMVIYIKNSNEKMEQMLIMEQKMQQLQTEYYEALLEKEQATRRYRHDMNNHLICLNRLLEDGDINGTKAYLGEMNVNLQEIKRQGYNTGITILDVLVNYHVEQLKSDAVVKVKGCCTQPVAVSDIDMCIIFSNVIQNAVEALNRSDRVDDFLRVEIKEGKEYVRIRITNSILPEMVHVDAEGNLQTVKKDKQNHGIGILNVKETIYKNGGTIDYQIEEGQISCEICFSIG